MKLKRSMKGVRGTENQREKGKDHARVLQKEIRRIVGMTETATDREKRTAVIIEEMNAEEKEVEVGQEKGVEGKGQDQEIEIEEIEDKTMHR